MTKLSIEWNAIRRFSKIKSARYSEASEIRTLLRAKSLGFLNGSRQTVALTKLIFRRFREINRKRNSMKLPPA